MRYPIKTGAKDVCDTITASIAQYEKYRCWASKKGPTRSQMCATVADCARIAESDLKTPFFCGFCCLILAPHFSGAKSVLKVLQENPGNILQFFYYENRGQMSANWPDRINDGYPKNLLRLFLRNSLARQKYLNNESSPREVIFMFVLRHFWLAL